MTKWRLVIKPSSLSFCMPPSKDKYSTFMARLLLSNIHVIIIWKSSDLSRKKSLKENKVSSRILKENCSIEEKRWHGQIRRKVQPTENKRKSKTNWVGSWRLETRGVKQEKDYCRYRTAAADDALCFRAFSKCLQEKYYSYFATEKREAWTKILNPVEGIQTLAPGLWLLSITDHYGPQFDHKHQAMKSSKGHPLPSTKASSPTGNVQCLLDETIHTYPQVNPDGWRAWSLTPRKAWRVTKRRKWGCKAGPDIKNKNKAKRTHWSLIWNRRSGSNTVGKGSSTAAQYLRLLDNRHPGNSKHFSSFWAIETGQEQGNEHVLNQRKIQ